MEDSNERRVLWVGNLTDAITEDLLFELFLQAGPLENVKIPKDKSGTKRNFAFVTFKHEESVPYTIALMDNVCLFGRPLKLQTRSGAETDNPYLKILHRHRQSSYNNGTNSPYDKYSHQSSRHSHSGNERNHTQSGQNQRYDMRRYSQSSEPIRTPEREQGGHIKNCDNEGGKNIINNNFRSSPSDYQRLQNNPKPDVPPLSVILRTPPPRAPQMPFPFGTNSQWGQQEQMRMFFYQNNCVPLLPVANMSPFQQFGGNRQSTASQDEVTLLLSSWLVVILYNFLCRRCIYDDKNKVDCLV